MRNASSGISGSLPSLTVLGGAGGGLVHCGSRPRRRAGSCVAEGAAEVRSSARQRLGEPRGHRFITPPVPEPGQHEHLPEVGEAPAPRAESPDAGWLPSPKPWTGHQPWRCAGVWAPAGVLWVLLACVELGARRARGGAQLAGALEAGVEEERWWSALLPEVCCALLLQGLAARTAH